MGHLTSDELIDLAEGIRPEASAPHLQACRQCQRQLADLRAMMTAAADVEVPEPSPLFWDHLSARVHAAVEADGAPRRAMLITGFTRFTAFAGVTRLMGRRLAIPLSMAAFAAIVIATMVTLRVGRGTGGGTMPPGASIDEAAATMAIDMPAAWPSDPSLDLVADLAAQVDWDAAEAPGLETHEDASDKAIGQLTAGERRELQRLLKEELSRSGA